jgi:hypothetical protein
MIEAKPRSKVNLVTERAMCAVFMSRVPSVYSRAIIGNRLHDFSSRRDELLSQMAHE